MSMSDQPLQLIRFGQRSETDEKTEALINHDVLNSILKQCGDHPICVICICGPSRKGKSFILGYMIRYYEALEKEQWDWMDHSNPRKPLTGFQFENRVAPLTKGIWIWSRPFIVPSTSNGKPVAVLLVDTQGTGDEYTTESEMTTIVSLSLLFSSKMIFNFFTLLDEKTLGAFDTYIQYGLLAKEKDDEEERKPFQNILFLIRDWNCPDDFHYGLEGGQEFLGELLKLKNGQPKEAQRVRTSIKDCFEEINCFLMPHIGRKALTPSFTGSVSELDKEFAEYLEDFVGNYLDPKNLVIKQILGSELTAPEFKSYLESYVKIFNSDQLPKAICVWDATVEATSRNLIDKALKSYVDGMTKLCGENVSYIPEQILKKHQSEEKIKALSLFTNAKKFGTEEKCEKFEDKLLKLINNEAKQFNTENDTRRRDFISQLEENAQKEFQKRLQSAFPLKQEENSEGIPIFFEEKQITQLALNMREEIVKDFEEKFTQETERVRKQLVQKLNSSLDEIIKALVNANEVQKGKAEEIFFSLQKQLVSDYSSEFGGFSKENEFAESKALEELHENLKKETISSFNKKTAVANQNINQNDLLAVNESREKWEIELKTCLDKEFQGLLNSHERNLTQISSRMEDTVEKSVESYSQEMGKYVATSCESQSELEIYHEKNSSVLLSSFNDTQNPYPTSSSERVKLSEKLEKALNTVFESLKQKLEQEIRGLDDFYCVAVEGSVERYGETMNGVIQTLDSPEKLEELHVQTMEKEMKLLEEAQVSGENENLRRANLPRYLSQLERAIASNFEIILKDFTHQMEKGESSAIQWKMECLTQYETAMKNHMKTVSSMEELKSKHDEESLSAGELLMDKVTAGGIPQVSFDKLSSEFEQELEGKWEEIKGNFRTKLEALQSKINERLQSALDLYRNEMETHFKNNQFIHPLILQDLHDIAVEVVFKNVFAPENVQDQDDSQANYSGVSEQAIRTALDKIFQDYSTRNDMNLNQKYVPAIGIDLGTTNCCVSVYKNGEVQTIPSKGRSNFNTTPSYVTFNEEGTRCVSYGHAAKDEYYVTPKNTIFDVKRIIGKSMGDEDLLKDKETWPFSVIAGEKGQPMIKVGTEGVLHTPPGISALLLAHLRESVEEYLMLSPQSIKKAVITVPAYFDSDQRQATVDAGTIAGFDKVDLLTEPVAAAIAYKLNRNDKKVKKVLVYDLGGGTFDVAVIDVESGVNVHAIGGDKHLGGEDFDRRLMEHCARDFTAQTGIEILPPLDCPMQLDERTLHRVRRLQARCEIAKKNLSTAKSAVVSVDAFYGDHDLRVEVTQETFVKLNEDYFQKTIRIVEDTIRSADGVQEKDIDEVILVGGSTAIPRVRELLQDHFNGKALNYSVDVDEAIAYGAAHQAAIINGADVKSTMNLKVQDVVPMSLGVEIVTREFSVIVERNTKIPCTKQGVYRTVDDDQTDILFKVYQGEKAMAADNRLLGKFTLSGLPPNRAGMEKADVSMEIDAMGILHVTAVSKSLNHVQAKLVISEESQRIERSQLLKLREENARMIMAQS
ncbi:unnamed protein product [Orchesella dallaii]|uniref:GB1/RHD3-type G domain-containing protein n=1 Tax=Orchesella dallaii TaxID=48710 RepID=A0ABP1S753_9HEXA